nr:TPA: myosin XI subclass 2 isoform 1 [Chara braunii]
MGSEEARSAALGIGSPVWVEDVENAWIEATVVKRDGDAVTARTVHGDLVETRMANALPRDEDVTMRGVDDMTKLSYLHEPGVLHNLYARYKHDEIYTYTGNILIAVNPFTRLPHLFNTYMMKQYQDAQPGDLNPHVYSVADAAYKAMMEEMKSQSILVSGESGAGKTETTKQIMQYLAFVGGRTVGDNRSVEQQVLQSNPLLEAFGNAKTVRNNNSSRFGKFVEIQFNNGKISGAAVRTYLLERSRVTQISTPERNYHCFYQLVAGASHEDAERLKLGPPDSFHYLNQSKCVEVGAIDDCKEYQLTREAMDIVGITTEEQEAIFRTIAAVLHLGNIEFNSGESEASEVSTEKSKFHLKAAADMLMCDEEMLEKSLTTRIMKATRTESITKILNKSQATDNRDALARTIYAKLFDWLVNKVNKSIGQDPHSTVLIGVLDIYGFESFEINSFEQFCINLTNEKLQQHFNTHVFKMEQAEYRKEEINWDDIDFVDNIDVLDLIEKRPLGIIALLDEACMLPRSTAESFARKLGDTFHNHKRFSKHKFKRTAFTIDHYAGQVEYRADLFLEKNKDFVVPEHQQLLHASKCAFVSGLFPLDEGAKAPSKFMSIGSQFKLQLATLMETLKLAAPHYIRCVKPNMQLKPQIFENKNVLQQLRCSGVLEAVRISCAGFPTRRTFEEFLDRFGLLHPEVLIESADEKVACQNLLEKCNLKGYQIGKTKVFLRAGQMAILDTKRSNVLNEAAVKIQHMVQSFLMRKDYERMKSASLLVQAYWRGTMARLEFRFLREQVSAVCFQRYIRGYLAQKNYLKMQQAAIRIQSAVRSLAARRFLCFLEDNHAATQIQSKWRSYVAFRSYDELLRSCIVFQGAWRCKEARSEIKKLRQAARETGALREAKNRLEKKCEELTLRLGLAKVSLIARNSELAKLQSAMEEAKAQVEQMKMLVAKERKGHEADLAQAKVAAAQLLDAKMSAQPSKEVLDKIEALSEENTKLKKLVEDYEKKKALAESSAKRIEEADLKRDAMQELLSRSEEQVQNLISENQSLQSEKENLQSENRILRQQALNMKDLESENQDLQRNLTHLETNSQALRAENETLKQQLEQLTSKGGTAVKIGQPAVTPWLEATDTVYGMSGHETGVPRRDFRQYAGRGQVEGNKIVPNALHSQEELGTEPSSVHRLGPSARNTVVEAKPEDSMIVADSANGLGNSDAKASAGTRMQTRADYVGAQDYVTHTQMMQPFESSPSTDDRNAPSPASQPLHCVESASVSTLDRPDHRRAAQGSRVDLLAQGPRQYESRTGQRDTGHSVYGSRPEPRTALSTGLSRLSHRPETGTLIKPTPEPVITTSYPDEQPTTPGVTGPGTPSRPLGRSQHIRRESSDYMSLYLPEDSPVPEAKPVDQKKSKMMPDKLQSDQEALFDCLMQDVGFSKDHPVAAVIIFKCLLQWHSFEAERTNVFDRIINAIQTAIESHSDNNDVLAYWLSNTSTLLHLLQRTLKAGGGGGTTPQRRRQTTLFGRMTQRFSSQQQNYPNGTGPIGLDNVRQVEAKYPALLFKQQLTAYVEKIYGMLRDNLKKEITPLLGSCIQAPRAPRHQLGRKVSLAPGQQVLSSHWGSIINSLLKLLNILRGNKVPPYLVRKTFTQIFSFINVQLLNSLLLRRECCSFSNGEYIKAGLAQLEHWIYEAGEEYAGASWEELRYIRQAVGFLVIHQKPKKSLDEIMHDLCPALSIQQLYRISTMYWDDKYGTHTVAPEVIQNMRILMTEDSNNAVSNSFLLDDDSGIPFSVDDISKSMPEVDLSEVHPPPLLKGMPSFRFLQPEKA